MNFGSGAPDAGRFDIEHETELARRLKARVRRDGPISFRDFMAAALFDADLGYYARGPEIGPGGDFSTSVRFEAFRRAVARLARVAWERLGRPSDFRVVELGAGTGQLAETLTREWRAALPDVPLEYVTVEASAGLRARQAVVPGVRAVASARVLAPAPSLVFGNEVLDALPVHRVVGAREGLVEVFVDVDVSTGRFRERLGPLSDPRIMARFEAIGLLPQRGQVCEVCLDLDGFVADAARLVAPGFLVFVDYGEPAPSLYAPTRLNGTIAAYRAHGKFHELYDRVGEQDLTADVDFTATTLAAEAAGMEPLGLASQGEFMEALGIADLGTPDEVTMLTGAARLGSAFSALAFRRGTTSTLPGF